MTMTLKSYLRQAGMILFSIAVPALVTAQEPLHFPPATPESQGVSSEALERLSKLIRGWTDSGVIVGAELLVIKNRHTILNEPYGLRDRENQLPMVQGTIFNLASMTKPLTGAALQILIDDGKVRADAPVAKYLPGFDNAKSRKITVEQIMTHRSGLPATILDGVTDYRDLVAMGNATGERGPKFKPGSKFWYSDSGTDAVGAIVQQVSGVPLAEFVRTRLLDPLGMRDSLYTPKNKDSRWARTASLYFGAGNTWTRAWSPKGEPLYSFAWGSKSLYGTAADYAKFLAMWMDGGMAHGKRILSQQAIRRTLVPVSEMTLPLTDMRFPTAFSGLEIWYGQMAMLHLRTADAPKSRNPVIIGHSGASGTRAWAWPKEDLMVIYLTQCREQPSSLRIEQEIDRLLFHAGGEIAAEVVPEQWEPYLGTYVANYDRYRDLEFTVLVRDGQLALDVPGKPIFRLKKAGAAGKWAFVDFEGLALSFDVAENGKIKGMRIHKPGIVHELPKGKATGQRHVARKLKKAAVAKFLGLYRDKHTGRDYEMVFQDGALAVRVPGVPMLLEFDPPDAEGYRVLRLNPQARIRFNENEEGGVISYTAYTPAGNVVRPRIEKNSKP